VAVSYFEWVHNLQQFFWGEAEVFEKEEKMTKAFHDVHEKAVKHGCTYCTGAILLALDRVYNAYVMCGW
jgi:glutamate dehydrogenase/leucine dehydrogenase